MEGHRSWRRLRAHLEKDGFVKTLRVVERGRSTDYAALQLLKPFDAPGGSSSLSAPGLDDDDEEEEEADVERFGMFAEKSFHWHAMRAILQTGAYLLGPP